MSDREVHAMWKCQTVNVLKGIEGPTNCTVIVCYIHPLSLSLCNVKSPSLSSSLQLFTCIYLSLFHCFSSLSLYYLLFPLSPAVHLPLHPLISPLHVHYIPLSLSPFSLSLQNPSILLVTQWAVSSSPYPLDSVCTGYEY